MLCPTGEGWVDTKDPNVIAETELLQAAASIEAAAKKLSELQPRKAAVSPDSSSLSSLSTPSQLPLSLSSLYSMQMNLLTLKNRFSRQLRTLPVPQVLSSSLLLLLSVS